MNDHQAAAELSKIASSMQRSAAIPSVQQIAEIFKKEIGIEEARQVRDLMRGTNGRQVEDNLEKINKLIRGYGVEVINSPDTVSESPADRRFWQDAILAYCNMGDTYAETVWFDTIKERWGIGDYGTWLEQAERDWPAEDQHD